jgi:hypothetical protein
MPPPPVSTVSNQNNKLDYVNSNDGVSYWKMVRFSDELWHG